jgi:hypothetical protein
MEKYWGEVIVGKIVWREKCYEAKVLGGKHFEREMGLEGKVLGGNILILIYLWVMGGYINGWLQTTCLGCLVYFLLRSSIK